MLTHKLIFDKNHSFLSPLVKKKVLHFSYFVRVQLLVSN
jgi:hypothetical protein